MWRLWVGVVLLVVAAAMLVDAAVSRAWYQKEADGLTIRYRLLGLEACADDGCDPGTYDPEVVAPEEREEFKRFIWAGKIAYALCLAAAVSCLLTIVLAFLGKDGWIDKHVAGWLAFLGGWAGLAFCDWKPSGTFGLSARAPIYLAGVAILLVGAGELLASDGAMRLRVRRDARKRS